jgi:hypothetical protein
MTSSEFSEDRKPLREPCRASIWGASLFWARQGEALAVADRRRKKLKIVRTAAAEPMSACDQQAAEAILARLVARAFAADHPELFRPRPKGGEHCEADQATGSSEREPDGQACLRQRLAAEQACESKVEAAGLPMPSTSGGSHHQEHGNANDCNQSA